MMRRTTMILVMMAGLALAACSGSDTNRVVDGNFAVSSVAGHTGTDLSEIQATELAVHRSSQNAVFTLDSGAELSVPWSHSRWISGCPTMQGSTRLQVLEITDATLVIGSMEFVNPVLTATCGDEIVLTEDVTAVSSGAWSPCAQTSDKCLTFQPTL